MNAEIASLPCPICRGPISSTLPTCPDCGYRPGSLPDWLLTHLDLGIEDYTFQSARGVDYAYAILPIDGEPVRTVSFGTRFGAELDLNWYAEGVAEGSGWRMYAWLGDALMTQYGFLRPSEAPANLRDDISGAIFDINAESEGRRIAAWHRFQGRPTRIVTAPDRLRTDFSLGPDARDFTSAAGRTYSYAPQTPDSLATVSFHAPAAPDAAPVAMELALLPSTSAGLSETRLILSADGRRVAEDDLLRVDQFPAPLRPLIADTIRDLNAESVSRAAIPESAR